MAAETVHLSDEALVALVSGGDGNALAALYDRFGRAAYAVALRLIRDAALAEDAVQDAFLSVWKNASRYAPARGRASTWILTLVHNRAVDVVRREQRRPVEAPESADEESGERTDETALARLERERVQAALRSLPARERETIELAYYAGLTQSQIAHRLGEPLGTIKSRTFTGLKRLHTALAEPALQPGTKLADNTCGTAWQQEKYEDHGRPVRDGRNSWLVGDLAH